MKAPTSTLLLMFQALVLVGVCAASISSVWAVTDGLSETLIELMRYSVALMVAGLLGGAWIHRAREMASAATTSEVRK